MLISDQVRNDFFHQISITAPGVISEILKKLSFFLNSIIGPDSDTE
jgi:hypothetical protein